MLSILWHIAYILLDFGQSMNLDSQTMPYKNELREYLFIGHASATLFWLHCPINSTYDVSYADN